jgi:Group II intron, maturase-specific domain
MGTEVIGYIESRLEGKFQLDHQKYLNVFPSKKAVQRERAKLHAMTNSHPCFKPISTLLGKLNRRLQGWANYFSFGYPLACTGRSTGTCEAVFTATQSAALSSG